MRTFFFLILKVPLWSFLISKQKVQTDREPFKEIAQHLGTRFHFPERELDEKINTTFMSVQ